MRRSIMIKKAGLCLILAVFSGQSFAHGYPTEETVRYVLGCMAELGEQNDTNMYTCVCRYDVLQREIPDYEVYNGARIYERFKVMPGEKGGFFRDNPNGERYFEQLNVARQAADSECLVVKHLEAKKPDPDKEVKTYVE